MVGPQVALLLQPDESEDEGPQFEFFLKNLKEKCATMDADYDKRVKDRTAEINAVADTMIQIENKWS